MKLINTIETLPAEAQNCVVAIGNFDGVHLGHQAVLGVAGRLARDNNLKLAVLNFDPHPRRFFKPDQPPFFLTPPVVKNRLFAILNIDYVFVQNFTKLFSLKTAPQFIEELLVDKLKAKHIVTGDQFHFGNDRLGDIKMLRNKAEECGFQITAVRGARDHEGNLYSSSRLRDALSRGEVKTATHILGRPWEVSGVVQQGKQQAREFGFPTANITLGDYFRPLYGVYAVRVGVGEGAYTQWHNGVANFGVRPTLDGKAELMEPHLFDFNQDLYNQPIRVQLVEFLRPEQQFTKIGQLRDQIHRDAAAARALLEQKYPVA